jgi:hypothetical protein
MIFKILYKRIKYTNATLGMKKNSENMIGNKYFLGKTRSDISKIMSKSIKYGEIIFPSKRECMSILKIKNNYQFYKLIKTQILYYI